MENVLCTQEAIHSCPVEPAAEQQTGVCAVLVVSSFLFSLAYGWQNWGASRLSDQLK